MKHTSFAYILLFSFFTAFAEDFVEPSPTATPTVVEQTVPMGMLSGRILEKGTKRPLTETSIYILPSQTKAVTDEKGFFSVEVPVGENQLVVNLPEYNRYESGILISADKPLSKTVYLEKITYQGEFETVVVGKKTRKDPTQKGLTQKQFQNLPGSGGDPIRAVTNLAGINRPAGFTTNVVIQGAGLTDTQYLIDGHEVPLVFHFGGLSTIVFPEAVESVDFFSAGYGPRYSRALGGLVGVTLRSPRNDRTRGVAFVDLINAGGLIEGGFGKHSFLFSFRQSYIGQVLKAVSSGNDDFSLSVAPRFTDVTSLYEYKINTDKKFRLTTVGSIDAVEFVLKNPAANDPFLRGNFESDTKFIRVIPQYSTTGENGSGFDASMGLGWTKFRVDIGDNLLYIRSLSATPRTEWRWRQNERVDWTLGTDSRFFVTKADVLLPNDYAPGGVFNPLSGSDELSVNNLDYNFDLGAYSTMAWNPLNSNWTLTPGVRLDYFSSTKDVFLDPRLAVAYDFGKGLRVRSQGGLYHQPPEPRESDATVGNPDLATPKSWHLSVVAEKDFRKGSDTGVVASAGPFFRWFDDIVTRSNSSVVKNGALVPEFYNSSTTGHSFGGETTIKYRSNKYDLQLAYMILKSVRNEPLVGDYRSPFDQTHNLNLIAGVNLKNNWRLSSRVRYVTGNPYTPVTSSVYDADNGVYIPQRGTYYSQRVAGFFQWDVRADKKWIYDNWILSLYLDIQNATNRANPEAVDYSYDYQNLVTTSGLPVLPTLGLKGEF